jgi:hypothetical protein
MLPIAKSSTQVAPAQGTLGAGTERLVRIMVPNKGELPSEILQATLVIPETNRLNVFQAVYFTYRANLEYRSLRSDLH